jgi:hypothetical protein
VSQDIAKIIATYVTSNDDSVAGNLQEMCGVNFDTTKMCAGCLQLRNSETAIEYQGEVRSVLERCRGYDGCIVCATCGFARSHVVIDAVAHAKGIPPCSECDAVQVIAAKNFRLDQVKDSVANAAVHVRDRERQLRCIDLFGAVAGATAFVMRTQDRKLDEEQMLDILRATLDAVGVTECDLYVNRFFDRVEETMGFADQFKVGRPLYALPPV